MEEFFVYLFVDVLWLMKRRVLKIGIKYVIVFCFFFWWEYLSYERLSFEICRWDKLLWKFVFNIVFKKYREIKYKWLDIDYMLWFL